MLPSLVYFAYNLSKTLSQTSRHLLLTALGLLSADLGFLETLQKFGMRFRRVDLKLRHVPHDSPKHPCTFPVTSPSSAYSLSQLSLRQYSQNKVRYTPLGIHEHTLGANLGDWENAQVYICIHTLMNCLCTYGMFVYICRPCRGGRANRQVHVT